MWHAHIITFNLIHHSLNIGIPNNSLKNNEAVDATSTHTIQFSDRANVLNPQLCSVALYEF